MAKKAKQDALPGMEDPDLHRAALAYASQESDLKEKLLTLMKQHQKEGIREERMGLTLYSFEGVEVRVVHELETVKVRIKKPKKEEAESE